MADPLEFDEKWQLLKARFCERLVNRFCDIDKSWSALAADHADAEALNALFHLVHSLAGSGATFGFDELSRAARALEPVIDPLAPQGPPVLTDALCAEVAARLAELRGSARKINPAIPA